MRFLCFSFISLVLCSCIPSDKTRASIGPPATRAIKTQELATEANSRLQTLASQSPFAENHIFTNYRARGPAQWSQGWPRRVNLTGISWSQKQAGTAITPRHIVLAAHYPIKKGKVLTFHDRKGNPHQRTIQRSISLRKRTDEARADITVALLDRPLPSSITTYRLLPPRTDYEHTLPGCPVLITEQTRRLYIHQVRRQAGRAISFKKNPDYPAELYKPLIKGDSGNPSFLLVGGEPVLIETHTGGGGGAGPFYSSPKVFAALEQIVATLDPTYRIKTVPLDPALAPSPPKPEPKPRLTRKPQLTIPPRANRTNVPIQAPSATTTRRAPRVRRVPTPPEEAAPSN